MTVDDPPAPDTSRGPWGTLRHGLRPTLSRTVHAFLEDHATQWAAALTFFTVLSVFPAMLVLVSVLGLVGAPAVEPLISHLGELAPGSARDIAIDALESIRAGGQDASFTFAFALLAALWSASAYVGAFIPAANIMWSVEEARPILVKLRLRILLTLALLMLVAVTGVGVALTGPVAAELGDVVGLRDAVVDTWTLAKWPGLALVVMTLLALIYHEAPNVRHPGWRWVLPGAMLAVVIWVAAAVGLTVYLNEVASYNATYGSIGSALAVLVWLWLTNIAILVGAELNSEIERTAAFAAGTARGERGPFLPPAHGPGRTASPAR